LASNERGSGQQLYENLRCKKCIRCDSGNISLYFAIEQGVRRPYEYWHTIIVACTDCKQGQLERTYYDATDWDDILNQTEWYVFDETSMRNLHEFIHNKAPDLAAGNRYLSCPEPLSPGCNCGVHWLLNEAAKKLDSLTEIEMRELNGIVPVKISFSREGITVFGRLTVDVG
jgi:hypothetical protein